MPKYSLRARRSKRRFAGLGKRKRGASAASGRRKKLAAFAAARYNRTYVPRPLTGSWSGDGDRLVTTLKFSARGTGSMTAAGSWYKTKLNANSVYQPVPGGTVQPLGFDQFSTFFNSYVILMSKMTLVMCAVNTTDGSHAEMFNLWGYDGDDTAPVDVSTEATANQLIGQGGLKFATIMSADTGYDCKGKLVLRYTPKKTLGLSPSQTTVQSAIGANPTNLAQFHCGLFPTHVDNTDSYSWNAQWFIEYKVMFFDRKSLSASTL